MVYQAKVLLALRPLNFTRALSTIILPAMLLLASCGKEPALRADITMSENDPVMSARNIDVLFSDSGNIEARLTSPLMNRYAGESPYLEFPKGFKITMYDSARQVSSTITGNRGVRNENTRLMEAWGNVVVRNEKKNEQLNTEHLTWDENRQRIWTDVKVRITRPDQVILVSSMESNAAFTRYSIKDPTGEMAVKKDSI
jgi:LPS export ABC transporter protein LptC